MVAPILLLVVRHQEMIAAAGAVVAPVEAVSICHQDEDDNKEGLFKGRDTSDRIIGSRHWKEQHAASAFLNA